MDIASQETRLSFCQQLQLAGNTFSAQSKGIGSAAVALDLLGLGEVTASVSIERDEMLDCAVGTLTIRQRSTIAMTSKPRKIQNSEHSFSVGRSAKRSGSSRSSGSRSSSFRGPAHSSFRSAQGSGKRCHSGAISELRKVSVLSL